MTLHSSELLHFIKNDQENRKFEHEKEDKIGKNAKKYKEISQVAYTAYRLSHNPTIFTSFRSILTTLVKLRYAKRFDKLCVPYLISN